MLTFLNISSVIRISSKNRTVHYSVSMCGQIKTGVQGKAINPVAGCQVYRHAALSTYSPSTAADTLASRAPQTGLFFR